MARNGIGLPTEPLFFRKLAFDGTAPSLAALLQVFCVGLAALIPLGSGADRWRLRASCLSTALLAAWTYPVFAHWVWGGGWLAQLGANYGLGRGFLDVGGAGSIHVLGGLTALSVTWILGPRRGKAIPLMARPRRSPATTRVLIVFGCMLALVGWLGLNSAGAILFNGGEPSGTVLIAINTVLSAAAAALTAAVITNLRFGKPDASLIANGWVGGLVASSASCAFVLPAEAVVIGSIAGAVVTFSVEWFELRLEVDDPGGAVSVHAVGGIWGILALGLFGHFRWSYLEKLPVIPYPRETDASAPGQWLAQLIGIATLLGFVLPLTYGINRIVNRFYPYRVPVEGERQGMDLYELGAGGYPEFVTHSDDFQPR